VRPYRLVYPRRYSRRLEDIYERIAADNPDAAPRIIERNSDRGGALAGISHDRSPGRVADTRELIISGTPYIVPYRIKGEFVQIITVLHSAQRWPDRFP